MRNARILGGADRTVQVAICVRRRCTSTGEKPARFQASLSNALLRLQRPPWLTFRGSTARDNEMGTVVIKLEKRSEQAPSRLH